MVESFRFDGGLNGQAAPDKLAENQVAMARNVDFWREGGAARKRRGSRKRWQPGAQAARRVWRNYNLPFNYGGSPTYVAGLDGLWRIGSSTVRISHNGTETPAFGSWRNMALIANGPSSEYWADDGVSWREWVGQAPGSAPTATAQLLMPLNLAVVWTIIQGAEVSNAGGVVTVDSVDGRILVEAVPVQSGDLSTNGGQPIGDYGIHMLDMRISDPGVVSLIAQDYSIDSDDFSGGAFHAELRPGMEEDLQPSAGMLVEGMEAESLEERTRITREMVRKARTSTMLFPTMPNTWTTWAVARPQFHMTTRRATPGGWSAIGRIQVLIECTDEVRVTLRNFQVLGAETYPLNDPDVGYAWWETWAEVDEDGFIVRESAPSAASARVRVQGARAQVSLTSVPIGNRHGYTHRVVYRQGGYMQDAYRVGMVPLATTQFVDELTDVEAMRNPRMVRNVYSRSEMPGNVTAISEPFMGRVFVAHSNILMWSEPGQPDTFLKSSWMEVSHEGDQVLALIVWGNSLVVVNRDSVYELVPSGDGWSLFRSPCRYGTLYRGIATRTPYGIPLMTTDGLYMYQPGSGIEQRIDWLDAAIAPIFKRDGQNGRLVPFVPDGSGDAWAVWTTDRLYFAIQPRNTVYVVNMQTRSVSVYTYPFTTTCGFYDLENRLLVGAQGGSVFELEVDEEDDQNEAGALVPVQAEMWTRTWTWPARSRLMNITVDAVGSTQVTAKEADGTTITTTTINPTSRQRSLPSMTGFEADAVWFQLVFAGTVYGIGWDRFEEPQETRYLRTPYQTAQTEMHYQLAKLTVDTFSQPVTVQLFVDGQQVLDRTVQTTGPATVPLTLSARGWTTFAVLSASSLFRFYGIEWDGVPEPPRVTELTTPVHDFDGEVELKTMECTLDCLGGTVTATLFADAQQIAQYTLTGNGVKGYAQAAPLVPYGGAFNHPFCRTAYVHYQSTTPFKHYKTWYGAVREPSRVRHWRSETQWWADDHEIRTVDWAVEGFGQTVHIQVFVDSVKVHGFDVTASGHVGGAEALPATAVGRTAHVIATAAGPFKPYGFTFRATPLPPLVTRWRSDDTTWPSPTRLRTVLHHIDPAGGSVQAVVYIDSAVAKTVWLSGPRQTFQTGLDLETRNPTHGYVLYSSTTPFRHFATDWEVEPEPFMKQTWSYRFTRLGGSSAVDVLRRWNIRITAQEPCMVTLRWFEVGAVLPFHTVHLPVPDGGWREEWNHFPPGTRVMDVRTEVEATAPIQVHGLEIDMERAGVKGASRLTLRGTPA